MSTFVFFAPYLLFPHIIKQNNRAYLFHPYLLKTDYSDFSGMVGFIIFYNFFSPDLMFGLVHIFYPHLPAEASVQIASILQGLLLAEAVPSVLPVLRLDESGTPDKQLIAASKNLRMTHTAKSILFLVRRPPLSKSIPADHSLDQINDSLF